MKNHCQSKYLYDADGNPFHSAGTRIYRDVDGELIYDCPCCGRHWVPSHKVSEMENYALSPVEGKRPRGKRAHALIANKGIRKSPAADGVPSGIRTRVTAVKGRCPRPG